MANILCRPRNHDYDMAFNLTIVIMSYASQCGAWPLGRLVYCGQLLFYFVSFLFLFLFFCGYIAFVLRSTAIPAVRIAVRMPYSKLTCRYIYVSYLGRVGHTYCVHTVVSWYSYTRCDTSAVVALCVFVKITD